MIWKSMQEAYGKTLERQNEALGKKAAAAAATSRSKDKYSRSATQTLRRSARNAIAFSESSSSRDMPLPPIAEERDTQVIPVSNFAALQIQPQSSQQEINASTVAGGTIQSLITSSDKLVWGRFGLRSHTNTNARHAAALRSNRLGRFIDHLQNSNQNDHEVLLSLNLYVSLYFLINI